MYHYSFIGYMAGVAIIMILCVVAYKLLMEAKTSPSINRVILMAIYPISFILPLLVTLVPYKEKRANIEIGNLEFIGFVPTSGNEVQQSFIKLEDILSLITIAYFIGIIVTFLVTLTAVVHLLFVLRKSEIKEIDGLQVYVHNNKALSSFSWFDKIFLFSESIKDSCSLKILLLHEKAHLDRAHWIDLAIAQLILIFQWFNPAAWYIRRELQHLHEYEADEEVISSGVDTKSYQMLLIKNISGNRYPGLTDGLNNCSLKKRIFMMKKTKLKKDWGIRGLALGGCAILGGLLIHIPAVASVLQTQPESQPTQQIEVLSVSSVPKTEAENVFVADEESIKDVTIIIDGKEASYEEMNSLDPDMIKDITVLRNPSKIIINLKNKEEIKNLEASTEPIRIIGAGTMKKSDLSQEKYTPIPSSENDYVGAYRAPQTMAQYEGGTDQLLKDLTKTTIYPKEAYDADIQGRVVVRFQINTDGTTSKFQIARSVDPLLDKAAIEAIQNLPNKWIPGEVDDKPVATVFYLPVSFILEDSPKKE